MRIFKQIVEDANIPTDEAGIKNEWEAIADANGNPFSNNSKWSSFWRLVKELITRPALWLINLLIESILPNFYLKTATLDEIIDAKGWELELERKAAEKALGVITISRAETDYALSIPAGTRIETALINGKKYAMLTLSDATIPVGEAELAIAVEAEFAGADYNLADGFYRILFRPLVGVTVTNASGWLSRPGADRESNDEFRLRIRNEIGAKGNWNSDAAYRSIISSFPGIGAEDVFFEHGAPRGAGTANAHILFDVNAPADQYLQDIQSYIYDQGYHGHGDDLLLLKMAEIPHTINLDVYLYPSVSSDKKAQLQTDITLFVGSAFRQNKAFKATLTLPNDRFSFSRLCDELHDQFPEVKSFDFENEDIVTGLWIPTAAAINVVIHD